MDWIGRLRELYMESSKHSNYQVLPSCLEKRLNPKKIRTVSRYEKQRLEYISSHLEIHSKRILDIGGNTGFFTLEAIEAGAEHVDYYEGNKTHAKFVELALEALDLKEKAAVFPEYYLFQEDEKKYDIVYCMNVVHHLGEDFLSGGDLKGAKKEMLCCVNQLAYTAKHMVFQMGFNWCGNPDACLFPNGTKAEMEDFILEGTADHWDVRNIGIAWETNGAIAYQDMCESNNGRIDRFGEFLNRPIFLMRSKIDSFCG